MLGNSTNVRIQGNLIGTTADGASSLGNSIGVSIRSTGNFVGSDGDGVDDEREGNVIAASSSAGVELYALNTEAGNNVVAGNLIGTDRTGTVALPNRDGIIVDAMADVRIGGATVADANVISGSTRYGIIVQRMGTKTGVEILGNYIGTDVTGTQPMGNLTGVFIDRTSDVTIGSGEVGGGNVISANGTGVYVAGAASDHNVITGNFIGTNASGNLALGNSWAGISISNAPDNVLGGQVAGAGNVISGNNYGVLITGSLATGNMLQGNFIGTDATGNGAIGNDIGLSIQDASGNTLGGVEPDAGNLISGNDTYGVYLSGPANNNLIQGNRIGTDEAGLAGLGNGVGIQISGGLNNLIGGTTPGAGNLISGNGGTASVIISGSGASGNIVQGNLIGTDITGTVAVQNEGWGMFVAGSADNLIGGTESGAGNVISGNRLGGIAVFGSDAQRTTIQGNLIGTDVTGTVRLDNLLGSGIVTGDASGFNADVTGFATQTIIGGEDPGAGNVISSSGQLGIWIRGPGAAGNVVQQNLIGTDVSGSLDFGNRFPGIWIDRAPSNLIGGTSPEARNVISGNDQSGVYIMGSTATGNVVQGNYIGTDVTGGFDLGNAHAGVSLVDAPDNLIGGASLGAGNLISGNDQLGVFLQGEFANGIVIQGNLIGTNATGSAPLPNASVGIAIFQGSDNVIGGSTSLARNVVAAHSSHGIIVAGLGADRNAIQGNYLGTDATGTIDFGNGGDGIYIGDGSGFSPPTPGAPSNTLVGGTLPGEGNLISSNRGHGVAIHGGLDHVVKGNRIGTDITGGTALGNTGHGIHLEDASGTQIGGTEPGAECNRRQFGEHPAHRQRHDRYGGSGQLHRRRR